MCVEFISSSSLVQVWVKKSAKKEESMKIYYGSAAGCRMCIGTTKCETKSAFFLPE